MKTEIADGQRLHSRSAGCATHHKPPPEITLDTPHVPIQAQPAPEPPKPVDGGRVAATVAAAGAVEADRHRDDGND